MYIDYVFLHNFSRAEERREAIDLLAELVTKVMKFKDTEQVVFNDQIFTNNAGSFWSYNHIVSLSRQLSHHLPNLDNSWPFDKPCTANYDKSFKDQTTDLLEMFKDRTDLIDFSLSWHGIRTAYDELQHLSGKNASFKVLVDMKQNPVASFWSEASLGLDEYKKDLDRATELTAFIEEHTEKLEQLLRVYWHDETAQEEFKRLSKKLSEHFKSISKGLP